MASVVTEPEEEGLGLFSSDTAYRAVPSGATASAPGNAGPDEGPPSEGTLVQPPPPEVVKHAVRARILSLLGSRENDSTPPPLALLLSGAAYTPAGPAA